MRVNLVRAMKRTIVGATAVFTALAAVAAPAQAGPMGPCGELRAFYLNLGTGEDDLRDNSEVIVSLIMKDGLPVELQHVWGWIGNRSNRSYTITYHNQQWAVDSCKVRGVQVRMISHPGPFQTTDNWNMDSFTLNGYADWGRQAYTISASGAPIKRFTGESPWWWMIG